MKFPSLKLRWALAIIIALLSAYFFLPGSTVSLPQSEIQFHDGPDKAFAFNSYMIRDRKTNQIPYEKLLTVKNELSNARVSVEARDFNWQQISTNTPGRARAMFYNPSSSTIFSGSVTGGLWKNASYKSNAQWSPVSGFEGSAVNAIAQDPNNLNRLYLGTGESFTAFINYRESTGVGNGIYVSEDAGTTWQLVASTSNFYYINDIVVRDENGTSVIYAAVGSGEYQRRTFVQEGLYRSDNQGASWSQVLPTIPNSTTIFQVGDIELGSDGKMYVATMRNSENLGGSTILYSDNGVDWSIYSDFNEWVNGLGGYYAGRSIVKAAPSNPNHLYAVFSMGYINNLDQLRDYYSYLWQSVDGGASWTEIELPGGIFSLPWHAMALAIDPNDENKIVAGGLETYVLNDASTSVTSIDWIQLSYWAALYYAEDPDLSFEEQQFFREKYVHADIHDIQYVNGSSNELLITTDGGVFYTSNMGLTNNINPENPIQEFPVFYGVLKGQNTGQYYHASIHPGNGRMEAVAGAQDNGSLYRKWADNDETEISISGGDGGYSFFDKDDENLKITMVYGNRYYIHVDDKVYFYGFVNGLFVNPVAYDDESNLAYSNTATSSYGGLFPGLKGKFYDTLEILNVNKYLLKSDLGLDTISYVKLNVGLTEAITAIGLSKSTSKLNKTAVIGTENGQVYKVAGLPYSANTVRIDNDQLPYGYVSSVDIGSNSNTILITISNFGIESVWSTTDGGNNWVNLERNLPDIPVRWGRFNPNDDNKIMIATEMGIWGLESISDPNEDWQSYNTGFPAVRVDMFDLRASDRRILAATHGQGLYVGVYDQGNEPPLSTNAPIKETPFYPNPTNNVLNVSDNAGVSKVEIFNLNGQKVLSEQILQSGIIDVSAIAPGLYIVRGIDANGSVVRQQKIKVK